MLRLGDFTFGAGDEVVWLNFVKTRHSRKEEDYEWILVDGSGISSGTTGIDISL